MADEAGVLDVVEQEIGHAQEVRHVLFLDAAQAGLEQAFLEYALHMMLAHVVNGAGEEAAGAASGVDEDLAGLGIEAVRHELGDGAGGVEFPGVSRGLEVAKDFLVNVAEVLALLEAVEVDVLELVDDLAELLAAAHVVVTAIEDFADDAGAAVVFPECEVLETGEEVIVDEVEQGLAGHAFGIGGPVPPLESLGDRGIVGGIGEFPLGFLGVVNFQEKHPGELLDALVVAADTLVFAHFILDGLDGGGE